MSVHWPGHWLKKESYKTATMASDLVEKINSTLGAPVAVLCGGTAAEREVSLSSGQFCYSALQEAGVEAVLVDTASDWMGQLKELGIKQVFIALHGPGGEDGTIQGALEYLDVAYTGSGVLASALAMDKWRCKQLWSATGLPVLASELLHTDSDWQNVIDKLGGKVIVKPAHEGSSIGMSVAESSAELMSAYELAAGYDPLVFAEQWVEGGEFTVALLGSQVLPVIGLETDNRFYDFDAKYVSDETRYLIPSGLDENQEAHMQLLARRAYDALGCRGWGRVDFMQDGAGLFHLLEVNTIPGMTDHSLVPMAAKAAGMSFSELVVGILAESVFSGSDTSGGKW